MTTKFSASEKRIVNMLVEHYVANKELLGTFGNSVLIAIRDSASLRPLVHSMRFRMKDPEHLRDKLFRQLAKRKETGKPFDVTTDTLFTKITDLVGLRLLHLHTTQFSEIHKQLKLVIDEQPIDLIEGPFARTWDDEYRKYFRDLHVETQQSETMYTSVHYIVSSKTKTLMTCEIQVRTLMEEVWGEVDHAINYPYPVESVGCKEQIRALARSTSSATRLVDAIFATYLDFTKSQAPLHKKNRNIAKKKRLSRKSSRFSKQKATKRKAN